MKDIFMFVIINMVKFGTLKKANFYSEDFASAEFENGGKKYSINISCEKTEGENNE